MASSTNPHKHPCHRLDYDDEKYSEEELHQFYKQRTRTDIKLPLLRENYIQRLKALDMEATFRLKDLPTELRLLMYEELLLYGGDTNKRLCTNVLAASKEVNEEAMDVWRKVRAATASVSVTGQSAMSQYGLDNMAAHTRHPPSLVDMLHQAPVISPTITHMTIYIDDSGGFSLRNINNYLYVLANLTRMSNIARIKIYLNGKDIRAQYGPSDWNYIFWPLTQLKAGAKLVLDEMPARVAKYITSERARATEPTPEAALPMLLEAKHVAQDLRALIKSASITTKSEYDFGKFEKAHLESRWMVTPVDQELQDAALLWKMGLTTGAALEAREQAMLVLEKAKQNVESGQEGRVESKDRSDVVVQRSHKSG